MIAFPNFKVLEKLHITSSYKTQKESSLIFSDTNFQLFRKL